MSYTFILVKDKIYNKSLKSYIRIQKFEMNNNQDLKIQYKMYMF